MLKVRVSHKLRCATTSTGSMRVAMDQATCALVTAVTAVAAAVMSSYFTEPLIDDCCANQSDSRSYGDVTVLVSQADFNSVVP